jgi:hypothetical protein
MRTVIYSLYERLHSLAGKTRTLSPHRVSLQKKYANRFTVVFLKSRPKRGPIMLFLFS